MDKMLPKAASSLLLPRFWFCKIFAQKPRSVFLLNDLKFGLFIEETAFVPI